MRYLELDPDLRLRYISGRPISPTKLCPACGGTVSGGETDLVVEFVDPAPHPDAIGVLHGIEWGVTAEMRAVLETFDVRRALSFAPMRGESGKVWGFDQVMVEDSLGAGRESIIGSPSCHRCGGAVEKARGFRLKVNPLFIRREDTYEPPLACLLESRGMVLIREDVAQALREANLNFLVRPAYFEGESIPPPKLGGQGDWSDV